MEYLVPKPPGDSVTYYIDWTKQLGGIDAIETFALTVASGTVVISPNPTNYGTFIQCVISGGANGEIAVLSCTVNTVGLQVLTRQIQLAVVTGAESVTPSTATKRDLVNLAYQALGLADYEFNTTDEEYAAALLNLDALMAMWRTSNLDLNYNAPPVIGQSNLADESGIGDDAVNAVALALAMRLAPIMGKTMSPEARVANVQGMNALRARYGITYDRALANGTPRGAGQKPYGVWWPYGGYGVRRRGPCGQVFRLDFSDLDGGDTLG